MSSLFEDCFTAHGDNEYAVLQCITNYYEGNVARRHSNFIQWFAILAASLIFSMQLGFAMVSAGCVRKKNLQNTMLKNLLDACGAAVAFFCVGYGLAFGGQSNSTLKSFVGNDNFFGSGEIDYAFWFFQYACSATTVTIVAGTLAERCKMEAYLSYSVFLICFVYPVIVHAIWSDRGFLSPTATDPFLGVGVIDFAGSGVIHVTGGWTALIATLICGPRRGRFSDEKTGEPLKEAKTIAGHSVALQLLGTMVLWFGCKCSSQRFGLCLRSLSDSTLG
jgi:Amt family ammonium transporter